MKVYLAGPITGVSYKETTGWREWMQEYLGDRFELLSPLRAKTYLDSEEKIWDSYEEGHPIQVALSGRKGINARDHWDCSRADIIFVNLLGAKRVSIGTCMEIAWGFTYRKPVIVCMEEDNIHRHGMIMESATHIVDQFEYGVAILEALV